MEKLAESVKEIEKGIDTMYSVNNQILESKAKLFDVAKFIQDKHEGLVNNTLTCVEICKALNITEPTLIKRRNLGLIPFIKLGRNFYYLKPEGLQCSK